MTTARNAYRRTLVWTLVATVGLGLAGCGDDSTGPDDDTLDLGPTLHAFSFSVVVPTYTDLAMKAEALHAACVAFDADPTNAVKLEAAASAWIATREPWEASEAFLFGPAAFLSLDPALDSWPVDTQQLELVLASGLALTPENIASGLGPSLRGFHTIEYLLFRDQAPRNPVDVPAREREYLVSCSRVLADDAEALRAEWAGGFAEEFAAAGSSGSRYRAANDALLEVLEGMIGICDEVANGKIADPYDEQNAQLVESQFSGNSLTDFQDNMRSVQNAYTGGFHLGTDAGGIDDLVRARNAELDTRLTAEIQASIAAIAAIPEPFEHNLDQAAQIEAAQQAIVKIMHTLELDVKPLLLG